MLELDFQFPDWASALRDAEGEMNLFIAANIQTNRGMLFDTEGRHNGRPGWAPLSLRNGQVLSQRGKLRKSIAPYNSKGTPGPDGIVRFAGDHIVIGTNLAYARMMNYGTAGLPGGVLRPKHAKALRIPLPSGESANQKTRTIRAAPLQERSDDMPRRLERATLRATKARARFMKSGADKDLNSSVNAEIGLRNRQQEAAKLAARVASIHATGKGGKGFLFLKSVRIPARQFNDWNEADQEELNAAIMSKLTDVLNRSYFK